MIGIHKVQFDLGFKLSEAIRILKAPEAMHAECHDVTAMLNRVMRPEALVACYADMEVGETSVSA